ncbi:MAG TPA: argininosuccinate lyase [Terriglobia bacterium]|nr:argininosuccinate lyase [Terriglobia bacterium]
MKTWGGRFTQPTDAAFERFNSSFGIDQRLIFEDIEGSLAYAAALERVGILTSEELKQISKGLVEIKRQVEKEPERLKQQKDEDVHTYVERSLFELIGDAAYKLHTGRSRNDQVALDMRLFLKRAILSVQVEVKKLCRELVEQARSHLDVVIPGYTHLRKAQPLLFAHYVLAYFEMFRRDYERLHDCYRRTDTMPLGSGALVGNGFPIDREALRKELGFAQLTRNSLDAVSDRDYLVEFSAAAALILTHLSRMSEDLIIYSSSEFGFLELSDTVTTGSSIMPQKKNPDSLELVRGKTGRVYGNLVSLLTQLKGLPLAYNKDLQEDKESVFDTLDTAMDCLLVAQLVVRTLKVNREATQNAVRTGFLNATDLADYLVRRGIPFRKAHELVGRIVLHCEAKHIELQDLSMEEYTSFSPLIGEDVYPALTLENSLNARTLVGGTAPLRVQEALAEAEKFLNNLLR